MTWIEVKKKVTSDNGKSASWCTRQTGLSQRVAFLWPDWQGGAKLGAVGEGMVAPGPSRVIKPPVQSTKCLLQAYSFLMLNPGRARDTFLPPASWPWMQHGSRGKREEKTRAGKQRPWEAAARGKDGMAELWGAQSTRPALHHAGVQQTAGIFAYRQSSACGAEEVPSKKWSHGVGKELFV